MVDVVPDHVIDRFKRAGIRQGWWNGKKVTVALSGGSDSMALLWLMTNIWHGEVLAVHVDHGIRGDSSRSDASFVEAHCSSLGIGCTVIRRRVPIEAEKGESIELAARRIRHLVLTRFCQESGSDAVVLAHNSDDVIETFFLNMARGSGPYGLAGIPESRGVLFRPVMDISKDELRGILKAAHWDWVEDETNDEDLYLRNRVRNELLPLLENRINRGIRRHVLALVEEMSSLRREEDLVGASLYDECRADLPFCLCSLFRDRVIEVDRTRRKWLLRHIGRLLGLRTLTRKRTEDLVNLIERTPRWRFQWSSDVELCADRDHLSWLKREIIESGPMIPLILDDAGSVKINGQVLSWSFSFTKEERPFLSDDLSVSIPVLYGDRVELRSLSDVSARNRGRFPWWIKSMIPVVVLNDVPVWSPKLGDWTGRWDFSRDSVKCDGACLISFADPQEGQEGNSKNGL